MMLTCYAPRCAYYSLTGHRGLYHTPLTFVKCFELKFYVAQGKKIRKTCLTNPLLYDIIILSKYAVSVTDGKCGIPQGSRNNKGNDSLPSVWAHLFPQESVCLFAFLMIFFGGANT